MARVEGAPKPMRTPKLVRNSLGGVPRSTYSCLTSLSLLRGSLRSAVGVVWRGTCCGRHVTLDGWVNSRDGVYGTGLYIRPLVPYLRYLVFGIWRVLVFGILVFGGLGWRIWYLGNSWAKNAVLIIGRYIRPDFRLIITTKCEYLVWMNRLVRRVHEQPTTRLKSDLQFRLKSDLHSSEVSSVMEPFQDRSSSWCLPYFLAVSGSSLCEMLIYT